MKKNIKDRRLFYLILHQGCAIATAISIYAYDYIILRNPDRNELYVLSVW